MRDTISLGDRVRIGETVWKGYVSAVDRWRGYTEVMVIFPDPDPAIWYVYDASSLAWEDELEMWIAPHGGGLRSSTP